MYDINQREKALNILILYLEADWIATENTSFGVYSSIYFLSNWFLFTYLINLILGH